VEIYLIRHTAPDIENGICYGQTDIELADSFSEEALYVKGKWSEIFEDAVVYTSPLKRCLKLARTLAQKKPIEDNRLMELNFGDWEMKRWDDIDRVELSEWMDNFLNVRCPHGESYRDLYKRTSSFYEDMINSGHEKIIIVTHAGVMRSLLSYVNATPLNDSFRYEIGHGSVEKITVDG